MVITLYIFLFVSILSTNSISTKIKKKMDFDFEPEVRYGRPAKPYEFPYQATLQELRNKVLVPFCEGCILSNQFILTTAHCLVSFKNNFTQLRVMVGDTHINGQSIDHQELTVKKTQVHEHYKDSDPQRANNIGIIMTVLKIVNGHGVKPIPIPEKAITEGQCVLTGFGIKEAPFQPKQNMHSDPMHLTAIDVPLLSDDQCPHLSEEISLSVIPKGIICAGEGNSSCGAHEGGPLVCDGELTGVASSGFDCGDNVGPFYYTGVPPYNKWIKETMDKLERNKPHKYCHKKKT